MFRRMTPVQTLLKVPTRDYKPGYVQQFNVDLQRELPWGFFVDAAYAGSRGVHLSNPNNVSINNIPDSFYAQAAQQEAADQPVTITQQIPNPFVGITTVSGAKSDAKPDDCCGAAGPSVPRVQRAVLSRGRLLRQQL